MSPEQTAAALSLAGILIAALGAIVGGVLTSRAQTKTAEIAARAASEAAKKSSEESLIDQLQEELSRYRQQTDRRLETLEKENLAYRRFIVLQRDHMRAHGVEPPPWPDDLPR